MAGRKRRRRKWKSEEELELAAPWNGPVNVYVIITCIYCKSCFNWMDYL
jgi:hypothetical protein